MVDTDQGNLYITNGNLLNAAGNDSSPYTQISGGTTVQINLTQKIDYILQNVVTFIPIPISKGIRGTTPYARALDLKRITETISLQGFLADEKTARAIDKRNSLITLMKTGNALTAIWGLGNYQTVWRPNINPQTNTGAFFTKLQFTETAGLVGDAHTADAAAQQLFIARNIAIQLQLGRGKDM